MSDVEHLIGIMSGTSLDGADAVLARFQDERIEVLDHAHLPFHDGLREALLGLQAPGENEIDQAQLCAIQLARHYADLTRLLLHKATLAQSAIRALAVHGQTIRHRPERGYTVQLNAPALIAELTGIDVIADFRSRDVAAGGHGAPLVPAFHAAVFGAASEHRAVLNLGGMANLTDLPAGVAGDALALRGWDTGPGNVFLDYYFSSQHAHAATAFDADGAFAAGGTVDARLVNALRSEAWFALAPPKSTGRDRFNPSWLMPRLAPFAALAGADIQASLAQLTAETVADSLAREIPSAARVIVCGGGVKNLDLMQRIAKAARQRLGADLQVDSSEAHGVLPEHVEAAAFAWLGQRFLRRLPGNRALVTGARGARILGALYPA